MPSVARLYVYLLFITPNRVLIILEFTYIILLVHEKGKEFTCSGANKKRTGEVIKKQWVQLKKGYYFSLKN